MDASFHQLDDAKARAVHLLTCPLCTNQYTDPRVLPCQHTFCCRCLSAHVDHVRASSTRLGAFGCPVCLADVGLPAAGASAFPVDERIRSIRDLVVEEMAKDLASRIKERAHGDAVCNGDGPPGGRHGAMPLNNISERPGVDDDDADVDCGTWPSSARWRHVGDESARRRTPTADDPVFGRQRPGYSSVRGSSRTRRTRAGTTAKGDNDAPFGTAAFGNFSTDADARFSRERRGYSSMRGVPRTSQGADDEVQSPFDGVGRSQGRTASSGVFGNGHSSSQTNEPVRAAYERAASHVDVPSQSSPFDNINRDDDDAPYTPKIGRNRLAYSSLREMRRRPVFDPGQSYESPAGFVDDEVPGPFGSSGRFGSREGRVNHDRHADFQSHDTHDSESLPRAGSGDHNRTRYTSDHCRAREQKLPEDNDERESQQVRAGGRDGWTSTSADTDARCDRERPGYSSMRGVPRRRQAADGETNSLDDSIGRFQGSNGTADEARRQKPDSDDTPVLTVLSNLPADMKTAVAASNVSARAATSASDRVQSPTRLDSRSDEAVHHADVPRSPVPPVPHTHNDVASHVELDKTDDVANSKSTTSCSADISIDTNVTVADNPSPSSPDMFTPTSAKESAEAVHAAYQADFVAYKHCNPLEEGMYSPPCSPNESCFSRLAKFRSLKNSRQSAFSTPSTTESTSKETNSPSSAADDASAGTVPSPRTRARKRPPAFLGTPFDFAASGTREDAATSAPSVVRNDELNSESGNRERVTDRQFELQCTSAQVDGACNNDRSPEDADMKDGLKSIDNGRTAGVEDHQEGVDVSPTVEAPLPPGVETNDVQTCVGDVSTQLRNDDDSAMYSAGADSDTSVRSATEPCLLTPTTDDDDSDDLLDRCAVDEPAATARERPTDDECRSRDDNGRSTTLADFNVEHHQGDPVLIGEVPVESDDVKVDDNGGSLSTCSGRADEQNDEECETDSDRVNEDDVSPNGNESASEKHEGGESGCRTSRCSMQTDDVSEPDGYALVTGVAALGDGSLVVADYGAASVCLCDDEGRAEHRVTRLKPFSVAASTTDDADQLIYVGDRRRKTLLALDRHGADVAQWPDNQFDWVCGVACLPDGQLAVLDRSRTRQLGVYAAAGGDDGRPLAELGGQGSSLGDLCMAEFVAADSRGRLLVADSGNHCVKAFDRRVRPPGVVAVYGTTRGSGDAQLQWPKGVAVDSADNVLVADRRNGRVVAFSVDGRPLGSVVPAVRGPFAVCTLPTSVSQPRRRLVVASYSISGLSEFRLYDYNTDEIFV